MVGIGPNQRGMFDDLEFSQRELSPFGLFKTLIMKI